MHLLMVVLIPSLLESLQILLLSMLSKFGFLGQKLSLAKLCFQTTLLLSRA